MSDLDFYKGKNVFITGHTGFKGTWLSKILVDVGANVTGYALAPNEEQKLFEISKVKNNMKHIEGDVRDFKTLQKAFNEAKPEIVFHLAAQPLVREGYRDPRLTYETNVMGTVNILECVRNQDTVKSFLNVTTDKVYKNNEWEWGYRENETLDGYDPYSNSKSCSELVSHCYKNSFFGENGKNVRVSTARAGNVIGGGDFSKDRIIPDCIRAAKSGKEIILRNPKSIRPFQHVLDPLFGYLMIASKQYEDEKYQGYYNIGPNEEDCITVEELANLFCKYWGENIKWKAEKQDGPHEANFLKLDCSKIKSVFNWKPVWNIEKAVEKTVEFTQATDKVKCLEEQIREFYQIKNMKGTKENNE